MTLKQTMHSALKLGGVAIAVLAIGHGGTRAESSAATASKAAPCTIMCVMGAGFCLSGFHVAYTPSGGDNPNGSSSPNGTHVECYNLTCTSTHDCEGIEEALLLADRVETAIDGANTASIHQLLSANTSVSINRERNAVQVTGCGGAIAANVAVPGWLMDEILETR